MADSRQTMRLICGLAWAIVGLMLVVAMCAGLRFSRIRVGNDNVEAATAYAMEAAAAHLHNLEEELGPPWPAHGPCDYSPEFVKSTEISVEGRSVFYDFEIYITRNSFDGIVDAAYYTVRVEYRDGVFSLLSAEKIGAEDTECAAKTGTARCCAV